MTYYKRHIFFCLNTRDNNQPSCGKHLAESAFQHCKSEVKKLGINGKGMVRVNKAGCLDRCAGAPVAVVYPEGVWYSYVDLEDISDIVKNHLLQGNIVDRLLLDSGVGKE